MKFFGSGCLAALAGATLLPARIAHACAMCGLSPGDHEIHAFNTSVLFMLSAPYVIVGGLGAALYGAYLSARRKRRTDAPAARRFSFFGGSGARAR